MSIFDATEVELEHSNTNKNVERSNPSRTQQKRRATNESNAPNASNASNSTDRSWAIHGRRTAPSHSKNELQQSDQRWGCPRGMF